jgi:hypothetical protein
MPEEKILFYFYAYFYVLSLPGNEDQKCLTRADFLKGKFIRVHDLLDASFNLE